MDAPFHPVRFNICHRYLVTHRGSFQISEQPGHPTHLSNLPQWFWESWGEYIDDLKRLSKPKQR